MSYAVSPMPFHAWVRASARRFAESRTTFVAIRRPQAYDSSVDTGLAEAVVRISPYERFGCRLKRSWDFVRWSRSEWRPPRGT